MFRRLQSGLPADPVYPAGLDALGYYVNEIDEVRMKNKPNAYFNYFLTKNERYNHVQREAMNLAIRNIVLERLEELDLSKIRLPLGKGPSEAHVPILVSSNIKTASRVIVLFTDHMSDLGVFAYRIAGGPKGINAGSAVDLVKYLQTQHSSPSDPSPPGIIIGNPGQLRWWRRGKKAVNQFTWFALPRKSAVDEAPRFDPIKNTAEGNRDTTEHVAYVLGKVVDEFVNKDAKIDIIGVGDSCHQVVQFFNKGENWAKYGHRLNAFAMMAPFFCVEDVVNEDLAKFMKKRARAFVSSDIDLGLPICGPNGSIAKIQQGFVAPTFSLGPYIITESLLPINHKYILDWLLEVSMAGGKYENPEIVEKEEIDQEVEDEEEENVPWIPPPGSENMVVDKSWADRQARLVEVEDE